MKEDLYCAICGEPEHPEGFQESESKLLGEVMRWADNGRWHVGARYFQEFVKSHKVNQDAAKNTLDFIKKVGRSWKDNAGLWHYHVNRKYTADELIVNVTPWEKIRRAIESEDYATETTWKYIYINKNNGAFTRTETNLPGYATFVCRLDKAGAIDWIENCLKGGSL